MTHTHLWRKIVLSVATLVVMILFSACSGVGTSGGINSITGTITSVSATSHTVTITVSGQSYTVGGLSDQEIQALQSQVGKTYTVQVTQNSDGSYSINAGTSPVLDTDGTPGINETETPNPNETPSTGNEPGSISFVGLIQNTGNNTLTVRLPDGSTLTMAVNAQTDMSDLNGGQLSAGQTISVDVQAGASGFTATKIKIADSGDLANVNTVDFQGVTTQKVGSDNMLHFTVGTRSFSYAISTTVDLSDFGGNASSIASGATVKVEVQFTGTTGSITKISNANN